MASQRGVPTNFDHHVGSHRDQVVNRRAHRRRTRSARLARVAYDCANQRHGVAVAQQAHNACRDGAEADEANAHGGQRVVSKRSPAERAINATPMVMIVNTTPTTDAGPY